MKPIKPHNELAQPVSEPHPATIEPFAPLIVREYSVDDLSLAARWDDLTAAAIEPNPFLSRHFIVSAFRHLDGPGNVTVVEDRHGRLAALAVLDTKRNRFSLRNAASAYRSEHTFLTGVLLRDASIPVAETLLTSIVRSNGGALEFPIAQLDTPAAATLATAATRLGFTWFEDRTWSRAAIRPDTLPADLSTFSKTRRKSIRRSRKRLESHGNLTFRLHCPIDSTLSIETFLRLESMGWKGEKASAIECSRSDTAFLHDTVSGLVHDRQAVFAELSIADEVICSSINFLIGDRAFAFKIGWSPEFADGSPGVICELEFIQALARQYPHIQLCDSCSSSDSYLNAIWPERISLKSGSYISGTIGKAIATTLAGMRGVKRCIKSTLGR